MKTSRQHTRGQLNAMAREFDPHSRKPLQGCILLVGQIEAGDDLGATPLGVRQPKILLHSTALNDLLQNASLRRLPWYADTLLLLVSMALPVLALCWIRSPRIMAVIWLVGCALLLSIGFIVIVKTFWVPATVLACLGWSTMCGFLGTQRVMPSARRLARLATTHQRFDVFNQRGASGLRSGGQDSWLSGRFQNHGFFLRAFAAPDRQFELQQGDRHRTGAGTTHGRSCEQRPHLRRSWVEAEWRFFHDELRAGRKQGNLLIVTNGTDSLRGTPAVASWI